MRSIFALCLAVLFAHIALAKPAVEEPLTSQRSTPFVEASLSLEAEKVVPPPIVASGLPVPRWVTVKAARVNVRRGPSLDQEILWTYVKLGTPLEIIAEYDTWRRIRDRDGATGWVKSAMLDGRRNVIVTGRVNTALLRAPKPDSAAVAFAEPGLMARLVSCSGDWCEISTRGYEGYVTRECLWGVYKGEVIK